MNLKGQWSSLQKWQKYELKHWAFVENWSRYWSLKKRFLIMNEKGEN